MSYQVLARKWRPRNFSTLVGQEHVVRALTHALSENRLHHAYLFTGTRGVGKTTLARILAKSLNCESGVTAAPCGRCSACQEIDGGRVVDLLEVDAATNTRVDEMRQLLENAVYAPTRGRFKVYVIDEVHMLSTSAFNAMLKTLEEPPEHVKFILATTDPQKIPVTVLSRCLQFNLKQMPLTAIGSHLSHILEAEGIFFEKSALALIARSAAGSMRDALSLLDQAIAHGAGRVEEQQVKAMLGTVDEDFLFEILDALVKGQAGDLLRIASDLSVRSLSFGEALQGLASLLTRIQIAQCVSSGVDDDPDEVRIREVACLLSGEFVQLAYQIVNLGRAELPMAPDEHAGFVMTLLRLYTFRPERLDEVLASVGARPRPESKIVSSTLETRVAESLRPRGGERGLSPPEPDGSRPEWGELVDGLDLTGLPRTLAQNCELLEIADGVCRLRLAPGQAHLQMKPAVEKLQSALAARLGHPLRLDIEVGDCQGETLADAAGRLRSERQAAAETAIESDLFVRDLVDNCDAQLVGSSIKPLA